MECDEGEEEVCEGDGEGCQGGGLEADEGEDGGGEVHEGVLGVLAASEDGFEDSKCTNAWFRYGRRGSCTYEAT